MVTVQSEVSYEVEATKAVLGFHDRRDKNPDAMVEYATMFFVDYHRALHYEGTSPDFFLDAYAHKALAILNGASPAALDEQAFKIRQEWAKTFTQN